MNAPRQGLFAFFVLLAFLFNTIIVLATAYHDRTTVRQEQGNLLVDQLVLDALPSVLGRDSVALALLADRYSHRPDIAELKIYDLQKNVLATNGQAPTRSGQTFTRDVLVDQKPIGRVDIRMIVPSMGENLQANAIPILASGMLFVGLWLLYTGCARPIQPSSTLNNKSNDTHTLDNNSLNSSSLNSNAFNADAINPTTLLRPNSKSLLEPSFIKQRGQQASNAALGGNNIFLATKSLADIDHPLKPLPYHMLMRIELVDPKSLTDVLTTQLTQHLMDMGQTLLERSITSVKNHVEPSFTVQWLQPFSSDGALLALSSSNKDTTVALTTLLASTFNDAVGNFYNSQRIHQQMAFKTKIVLTDLADYTEAVDLTQRLLKDEKGVSIQLAISDEHVRQLMQQFTLTPIYHNQNMIAKRLLVERFKLTGLNAEQMERLLQLRRHILS